MFSVGVEGIDLQDRGQEILSLSDAFGETDSTSWTYEAAKVTAHTLGADDMRLTCIFVEGNRLMPAIAARQLTTATTHTSFTVDHRIDDSRTVELGRCGKRCPVPAP